MMKKTRNLTCIVCPRGCEMEIVLDEGGAPLSVSGNGCKRGIGYAEDECTHPKRTVTSTVMHECGRPVAVKTDKPIPKELIFEAMAEINRVTLSGEVKIGNVIIKSVCGTDADVVATANLEKTV